MIAGNQEIYVSVVVPVYNEEECLPDLMKRLYGALNDMGKPFEVIMIDDGSTDKSIEILLNAQKKHPNLRIIELARNFGQSPALYAGFAATRGQFVIMIDADLQCYPEDINKLCTKLEEGYDMVSGYRADRQDSLFRSIASRAINYAISRVNKTPMRDYGCSLKGFRREMVLHMSEFSHRCRYLPVDAAWLGGRVGEVEVRHAERAQGTSKYGLVKLFNTAFDILTSIGAAPLQIIGLLGWFFAFVGFAMSLRVAVIRLIYGNDLNLETVIAIFFFLAGIQLVATSLICEYVSRLYIEVQRRPYYVIRKIHED